MGVCVRARVCDLLGALGLDDTHARLVFRLLLLELEARLLDRLLGGELGLERPARASESKRDERTPRVSLGGGAGAGGAGAGGAGALVAAVDGGAGGGG